MVEVKVLIDAAQDVQANAHSPYSGYRVGVALEDGRGRIFRGCNVENVAYPVGMCAERVAIGTMIAAGGDSIRQIAIVTRDGGTPCGMCLQALCEFSDLDAVIVHAVDGAGIVTTFRLRELIPFGFASNLVKRSNDSNR